MLELKGPPNFGILWRVRKVENEVEKRRGGQVINEKWEEERQNERKSVCRGMFKFVRKIGDTEISLKMCKLINVKWRATIRIPGLKFFFCNFTGEAIL